MEVRCVERRSSQRGSSQRPRVWTRLGLVILAGLLVIGLAPYAAAQAVRGTLLGNITDSSGAAIPGATVTIIETQTNLTTSTVTNDSGVYTFPNLKDGIYRIEAELSGFRKTVRDRVQLDVNTTVRVDLSLQPGELTETVDVSAETPALQTDRTDTGRIIQGEQIAAMPLAIRTATSRACSRTCRAPRVRSGRTRCSSTRRIRCRRTSTASRAWPTTSRSRGSTTISAAALNSVLIPSAEALETVSVSTSNYDAEFGRAGGAVTSVTLKSGTNQFKGSGFYFGNTDDAGDQRVRRSLAATGTAAAKSTYNQGGFTLGGPIVRNKLFFFGDYVRTHDDPGRVNRAVVPTAAMRNGDFSSSSRAHLRSADRRCRHRREPDAVPGQPDPGGPDQPDRAAHPAVPAAAEHRRRGDRPDQLPGHDAA